MNCYSKTKKEYYRDDLLKIYNNCEKKPIILTAKYQNTNTINRMIFTNVKPYMFSICESDREKYNNYIFCKHITILRNEINKYLKLTPEHKNKRYLIMANLIKYKYNGIKRMGVELYEEGDIIPIMQISDTRKNNLRKSLFSKFYQYTEEDFFSCQKIKNSNKVVAQIDEMREEPPDDFYFLQFDTRSTAESC